MKPLDDHIIKLYTKYLQGLLTKEEFKLLCEWKIKNDPNDIILEYFKYTNSLDDWKYLKNLNVDNAYSQFQFIISKKNKKRQLTKFFLGAALISVFLGFSFWIYFFQKDTNLLPEISKSTSLPSEISDSKNPVLILSDGSVQHLDLGKLNKIEEEGVVIQKNEDGLVYNSNSKGKHTLYNTLKVPKGGMYNLTLSDGTQVWLNSQSSLKFPVHFTGQERVVYLEGEAYFEVETNASKPFLIQIQDKTIHVTGTILNVNAYSNTLKTTLIEGKASVKNSRNTYKLKVGYEGVLEYEMIFKKANIKKIIAWKNSDFYFSKDPIMDVLDEISRWYDVEIKEIGDRPSNLTITGYMSRDLPLNEVLELIAYTSQINFKIEGTQVYVNYSNL